MKPTLLILAAGIGSRYGGLKQIDSVGPGGETIIDYSIYDAIKAGFGKLVFLIRKDIEDDFKNTLGDKFSEKIETHYAFQELELPDGFPSFPARTKPWGTAHAVLAAKDSIDEPFAAINADDFYGFDAYKKMAGFLEKVKNDDEGLQTYSMVGYHLGKTLSDHGVVSRGVCEIDTNGNLAKINERHGVQKRNGGFYYKEADDKMIEIYRSFVSMNFWGFTPSIFKEFESGFATFIENEGHLPKSEYLIPFVVDNMINSGKAVVNVLQTTSQWYGVTYREDKPIVQKALKILVEEGKYPTPLW